MRILCAPWQATHYSSVYRGSAAFCFRLKPLTCATRERVRVTLKAEKPAHEKKIAFCKVDWDLCAKDTLAHDMRIPRRSTFVPFMGRKEVGRIVTGAARTDIEAFLETGLAVGRMPRLALAVGNEHRF